MARMGEGEVVTSQPVPGEVGSLLLAAGAGTRLRPLTLGTPKPILPLLDIPIGAFALARLEQHAGPVTVNVSRLGDLISAALIPYARSPLSVMHEVPEPYGSGGTVAALRERVARRLVTWNSDMLCDLELGALIAAHERSGAPATAVIVQVSHGADFKIAEGRARRLIDRRSSPAEAGARFLGIAVFEREVLGLIPEERPLDLTRGLLAPLIATDDLAVHAHRGYSLDVGTLERYLQASMDLMSSKGPKPPRSFPGTIAARGDGHAYVGPGARVDDDALGAGAVVLRGATVGVGARIERSIVWPGEHVPPHQHLSDCVWALGEAVTSAPPRK